MKHPRVYITGAAGAGVTTLGQALAARLAIGHVDIDDHYWVPTDPPYMVKRSPQERVRLIAQALDGGGWVLTGSFIGWGDALVGDVDLVVFVHTPTPVRMARLLDRERARHGARIEPGGDMFRIHAAFRDWASHYDDPDFAGRNRAKHEAWLKVQKAPVLRVDGTGRLDGLVDAVVKTLG